MLNQNTIKQCGSLQELVARNLPELAKDDLEFWNARQAFLRSELSRILCVPKTQKQKPKEYSSLELSIIKAAENGCDVG